jgi:hypothetical protein
MHFTPVHCSWMNQVEQWFSILQRKRLRAPNFADLADLEDKILAFITEWNEIAHPFNWTTKSFDKILNSVDRTDEPGKPRPRIVPARAVGPRGSLVAHCIARRYCSSQYP